MLPTSTRSSLPPVFPHPWVMCFHGKQKELRIYQLYFKTSSARVSKGNREKDPGEEEAPASPALFLPAAFRV